MLGLAEPPGLNWDSAFVNDSPIGWMALGSSKPGRPDTVSLLVQSTNDWAETHLETERQSVAAMLKAECAALTGIDLSAPVHEGIHRWRHAAVSRPSGEPFHLDEDLRLGACGDWCLEGRVEAAFTSGRKLAAALKTLLA